MAQAAERLGVSPRAVRARIERGTLKATEIRRKHGTAWRIAPADLEESARGTEGGTERERGSGEHEEGNAVRHEEREERHAGNVEAALLARVEWLETQLAQALDRHAQAEAEWRAIIEREQHTRASLEARILRSLPAPSSAPDLVKTPPVEPAQPMDNDAPMPAAEAEPPKRRPWWKLWG